MFGKLIGRLAAANSEAIARQGGLACPVCGAEPNSTPSDPDRLIICGSCGTKALPGEWAEAARTGGVVGHPDRRPALTRITRTSDAPGTIAWNIPASGESGGLLGKAHEKSIARDAIDSVAQSVFYLKNEMPVHGIEIRGRKRRLRFGSGLSTEEKSWLVGSLRREIFGPVVASPNPTPVPSHGCFSVSATHLLKHNLPFAIA